MMIVTLVPFILAARLNFPASSWNDGEKAQVTYLIQDKAIKTYSPESDDGDEIFHLTALLTCQTFKTTFCYFHDVDVHTRYVDSNEGPGSGPEFIHDDMWTKKILYQDTLEMEVDNGHLIIWMPVKVEPSGREFISALVSPMNIGLNFSTQLTGNFESKSNITEGKCRTRYLVTRSSNLNEEKTSSMELFLLSRPNENLNRPLEIIQRIDDDKCKDLAFLFSPFTARGLRKNNNNNFGIKWEVKKTDVDVKTATTDGFMTITHSNFTSFTKNVISIHNRKDNKKYVIDESISVTLQKIEEIKCDEVKDSMDCMNKELKKFRLQKQKKNH